LFISYYIAILHIGKRCFVSERAVCIHNPTAWIKTISKKGLQYKHRPQVMHFPYSWKTRHTKKLKDNQEKYLKIKQNTWRDTWQHLEG